MKENEQEPKAYVIYDTKTGEPEFKNINSRQFIMDEIVFHRCRAR